MTREIKFRVYNKKEKKLFDIGENPNLTRYPTNIYELIQYTGLKDKNGVEIFEGDIVEDIDGSLTQVRFGRFNFSNQLGFYLERNDDSFGNNWGMSWHWVIIGNIYENKDLLK